AARVPGRYFEPFARAVAARTKEPERSFARMKAVWPAHRFKWCCLLLNDFVPSAGRRRRFSQGAAGEERKKVQLEKAKAALQEII
ncbi:MAG: hypothetical protein NTX64_12120, partial [Elusimicrobia bacterium]|nr:hypothetical protein [Elusimicrobiota bacterium]